MNDTSYVVNHEKSWAATIADIKEEVISFVETRVNLFRAELKETLSSLKAALPLALIAAVTLLTAYLLLTLALVGLIAVAFWGSPYAWFFAFLIVGGLWLIAGGMLAFFAYNRMRTRGKFPKRTIEVLKADKLWLQTEARSQV